MDNFTYAWMEYIDLGTETELGIYNNKRRSLFGSWLDFIGEEPIEKYNDTNNPNHSLYWRINPDRTVSKVDLLQISDGDNERIVAQTKFKDCNSFVSTVFLVIDHNFTRDLLATPILFETMLFGEDDDDQQRCSTYAEAEQQHLDVIFDVIQERE